MVLGKERLHIYKSNFNSFVAILWKCLNSLSQGSKFLATIIVLNCQLVWYQYYVITERSDYLVSPQSTKTIVKSMLIRFVHIIGVAQVLYVLTFLLSRGHFRTVLRIILEWASFVVFAADVFSLYQYNTLTDYVMITIILACTGKEAVEFIRTFVLNMKLILFACICLVIIRLLIVVLAALYSRPKLFAGLLFMSVFFPPSHSDFKLFTLYRGWSVLEPARKKIQLLRSLAEQLTVQPVLLTSNNATIPTFVLILGESTSRHHMSLYGYSLKTNPLLEQWEKKGSLIAYNDSISPHCYTQGALEKLFTFACHECTIKWYESVSLIDIVRQAGYTVTWLSNQESISAWGNAASVISGRANSRVFLSKKGIRKQALYDEFLLPHLDEALRASASPRFFVLHLVGTHHQYRYRYPKQRFSHFTARDETGATEPIRVVQSQYDNAILYNDYIIDSIISRFQSDNAIILYLSDHGEEVYDNPQRSYLGHAEYMPSPWMVDIPLLFWVSNQFQASYPSLVQRIKAGKERPYMTDDIIHTILDIMDIATVEFDQTRSVISDRFNASRTRVMGSFKKYNPIR